MSIISIIVIAAVVPVVFPGTIMMVMVRTRFFTLLVAVIVPSAFDYLRRPLNGPTLIDRALIDPALRLVLTMVLSLVSTFIR
jgi:hypothetical protein